MLALAAAVTQYCRRGSSSVYNSSGSVAALAAAVMRGANGVEMTERMARTLKLNCTTTLGLEPPRLT